MMLEKNWYVVRAVSGQENKVKTYIENEVSRLGFEDYVEEVLVPTEKVIQVRNGKKINKERVSSNKRAVMERILLEQELLLTYNWWSNYRCG